MDQGGWDPTLPDWIMSETDTHCSLLHIFLHRWQSFATGILMFGVLCDSYSSYRQRIPNGSSVPNSCTTDTGDSWRGVGHKNPNGGGAKNDFGLDFAQASHVSILLLSIKGKHAVLSL